MASAQPDNFFYRLAFHVQGDQQGGDLRVGRPAGKDLRHDLACFFPGEGLAMVGDAVQGVGDH